MVNLRWTSALLGCALPALAQPSYVSHPDRTAAVKEAFQRSWDGYFQYAFPNDTLRPISKTYENDRNGWGASAVDAISTALVMGNQDVINQIVDHIQTINFQATAPESTNVSVFETTIRYLAGLLSAYDFLTGPLKQYAKDQASIDKILAQAVSLADVLSVTFNTPSGIPINTLNYGNGGYQVGGDTTNGLATIGTLVLEWTHLSDITGNDTYAKLSQAAEEYLLNVKNPDVGEPFPGLLGTDVNVTDGTFTDSSGGWNGGTDSYYEYLIKMYVYDQDRFGLYKDRWIAAVDSSIKYLASHPTSRPELTFLAAYDGPNQLSFVSTHLACFDGGNFILGGLTLDNDQYKQFGLDLVEACHETYVATVTGIGPEVFNWQDSNLPANASNNSPPPNDSANFYNTAGFWIPSGGGSYVLRPEVIESFYYAYRATGDTKYQDWAWEAFLNINATCSAGVGFSSIDDVNVAGGGGFDDFQESFWFAEVLKYSYLIQADDAEWQINAAHDNTWVFNTEAHPFQVKGKPI
ncbi:glycoside hydrolase family 47 protein [Hypoxylon trugodes]|uniref:glycoside hydrolase family 47 protein n=1 Tax=Hypoxylon trugodes TaxID=326681 RepID=UPI00218D1AC2|nr:glycoside hydrolase family 47 protein [Hypoxylon trugodes]KAI1387608.1 glycoside hydrolase family 47 protein [Hypoxylon trugodes]